MTDRIIDRYFNRNGAEASANVPAGEGEDAESFGSFGYLRGVRDRSMALELRKKSGHIVAIPYAFISKFEFEPATGIALCCGSQVIKIQGRNLNGEIRSTVRLFQGLTRFRVPWIQETERTASLQAGKDAVVVESIEW